MNEWTIRLSDRASGISPSPTLAIDAKAKALKKQGVNIINFGVGEPDFDTPKNIKSAAVQAIEDGFTKYTPAGGTLELKEAICRKLKQDNGLDYTTANIVVNVGAKHSLYNVMQVILNPGDEVILPAPYWVSYVEQIKLGGAVPVILRTKQENQFKITPQQLSEVITDRTKAIILNSPSNPTGQVYDAEELRALAAVLMENKIIVISDEIYEKLVYDGRKHVSIIMAEPAIKAQTILINGMSKAYAMTGWRIGYIAAPENIAKACSSLQSHSTSNPTSIAQKAALEALNGPQTAVEEMVAEFAERRDLAHALLTAIPGIKCNKPEGAFYLFPDVSAYLHKKYKEQMIDDTTVLADLLLTEASVAIVPGIAFGSENNVRLSYATSRENIKTGIQRIADFLDKLI